MSSAASSLPAFFGRAWKLSIATNSGTIIASNSDWNDEALKISFEVEQMALQAYWFADISIYNLNAATEQTVLGAGGGSPASQGAANTPIVQGDTVTLSAGYQKGFSPDGSIIFKGRVFQPMWERENVTDFKVTLRCVIGFFEDALNYVSFAQGAGATQAEIVRSIAKQAHTEIAIEQIDEKALSSKKLVRGKTIAGRPMDVLSQIARDNSLQMWVSPNGLNIRSLIPTSSTPDVVYGPPYITNLPNSQSTSGLTKQTIIGTPQQTQQGVSFRVLLDSELKIGQLVKIDMSAIRQLPKTPGQYPSILDQDGLYVVCGLRHVGDTRGNDWTTEIIGVSRQWSQIYSALAPQ